MKSQANPEFLPLIEWWEKDGKKILLVLVVLVAAWGGFRYWKSSRANAQVAASQALLSAWTTQELEDAVATYGSQKCGPILTLRLAKSYFDEGRYEEALQQYDALLATPLDGFEAVPALGRAHALEALGRYAEALDAFASVREANKDTPFALTATLGLARTRAELGEKDEALKLLAETQTRVASNEMESMRVENTKKLIERKK